MENTENNTMTEALHYKTDSAEPQKAEKSFRKKIFGTADKMFMAFMITFAASSMNYEAFIPEKAAMLYRMCLWSVCAAVWVVLSFTSGMKEKWQFELFAVLYLIVPQAVIFLNESGPEFCRFSIPMYSLSQFSQLLLMQPVYMLGNLMNMSNIIISLIYITISLLIFAAGFLVNKKFKFKR